MTEAANAAQREYWNDGAGPFWVEMQAQLDRQTEPLGAAALRALAPAAGEAILDIGCGAGQTTIALAARVGPGGSVTGADISRTMLAAARARAVPPAAATPVFREADAQTDDLGAAAFDAAFSRFGVMFFADPPAAFANIVRALKPGGRLAFVCWRSMAENPLLSAPVMAAAPFLPPMEAPDPVAPGPFAFADAERVRGILAAAGFAGVAIEPYDARVGGAGLEEALDLAFKIGPLGRALREHPDRLPAVSAAVKEALRAYETPAGVFFPAAVWIVTGRAP